jgi:uncharacterized repeat protein (TIGR03803 family)
MNTHIKNLFLLPALIAGLGLILTGKVTAQTFTTLHSFTYSDGINPYGGLILSGNTLYGTASAGANSGGVNGNGTLFSVTTNGTNFTTLYSFTSDGSPYYTNSDGANPQASLFVSGNTLYGTASEGGTNGEGTVFAVNTNGTNFTTLYDFSGGNDGGFSYAGLILSGSTLYGTADIGGTNGEGAVFAVNTNSTGYTNLYSFTGGSAGSNPLAGLILASNRLYGTTSGGNGGGFGSVFAINTDGTSFTNLHSFTANSGYPSYTNKDGSNPEAGLILSGSTLYGTASQSGINGAGAIFAVNTNGTGFTNLYTFTATSNSTNSDGANPRGGLIISGNTLYGTAFNGGLFGSGTVFAVYTNGTGFTNLHSFTANNVFPYTNSDGSHPEAELILSGNTLYGTAYEGGNQGGINGYGTVFSLSLGSASVSPPQLTITPSGTNVILTWPTNAAGFTLEFATNLVSPVVWSTNSTAPVVVNTNNVVTNTISGTQKFYRLSQ